MTVSLEDRIILALDYDNVEDVKNIVENLGNRINIYKVGLELFLNSKGSIIDYLHSKDKKVFLDLKFHDIPNTTAMASLFSVKEKVFMFNVHASGGFNMMNEVSKKVKQHKNSSLIIGVTILTSFTEEEIQKLFHTTATIQVIGTSLALEAKKAGLDGVVCSPFEAEEIKKVCGEDFYTICPGVRPSWSVNNDQKRIMTPKEAVNNGADFLVIGRPITKSDNPIEAVDLILEELKE